MPPKKPADKNAKKQAPGGKVDAKKGGKGGDAKGGITQVKVRHILCEKEAKLMEAVELIKNGASFNSVAQSHSSDKARVSSGLLGYISRGDMVPEFTDRAFNQPIGVVSEPFRTQFGYAKIK
ncbi:hypothetical protein ACTA71_007247 [Dictyostelium dimigraforme]